MIQLMTTLESMGISKGMITSTVITIVLSVLAIAASRNMKMVPEGFQNVAEMSIERLYGFFEGIMGKHLCKRYFPLVATLFIYILFCNYSGLVPLAGTAPGFGAPTSDINFPCGLAIMVFVLIQIIGIRESGARSFKRFITPFAVLFPILFMDELIKPVSLTFRLYGNIYGGEEVIHAFFNMIPIGLPVVFQALEVLMGLIQAMVFSMLTAIYISEAVGHEEEGRLPAHAA